MVDTKVEKRVQDCVTNLPDFVAGHLDFDAMRIEISSGLNTLTQPLPRLYQIETTSKCNLACGFCPRTTDLVANGKRDMNATMGFDQFRHVLDQMPWLKSVELFHFGEPFMQKDLPRFIQECTDRGIYSVIASNLLPATPEKLQAAFSAGLGFLVMDVDSLDPDRYASMRVNGRLDLLKERVLWILGYEGQKPYTVAQTINIDGKPEYTEQEFRDWTGGLMPDEIRYKFLDSFRGEIAPQKGTLAPNEVCREPFYGFAIHVDGNVVPCDRDWSGENVMGNIFKQDVMEIWNGEPFREFRAKMLSGEKPEMCRKCPEGRLFNARSQPTVQVNMFKGMEIENLNE
jgi:radical SAM protein with 4Fe4S-binding SPASM domain